MKKKLFGELIFCTDTFSLEDTCAGARASFHSKCSEEKTTAFIRQQIQRAFLKTETSQELHYILPFEEARKGGFERLFFALDRSLDELRITSYGIMDSSLEEVFLKITDGITVGPTQGKSTAAEDGMGNFLGFYLSFSKK